MSIVRIAQAANVSYATAWRIINNQPGGSDDAIAAVREAMATLGYDGMTRSKRGRKPRSADGIRTRNIALLHFRPASSISASVLSCVHQMLSERGLNLIFAHCQRASDLPQAVSSGNVDGILGYGQFPEVDATLRRVPAVWMMSRQDPGADPWGDRVKPDHEAIGELAASHLLACGHRHVAFLNPEANWSLYQQRSRAFRDAMQSAGVTSETYSCSGIEELNLQAKCLVEQLLNASPRPTGVFVPVDRVTLFIYRQLEQHGIKPCRDIDIVSCDNERELLSLMHPQPPSIDLNRPMIARLAVERLLWRMKNGPKSPSVVTTVSPTLVMPAEHAN
jgi:LacI family transcriptional regulator